MGNYITVIPSKVNIIVASAARRRHCSYNSRGSCFANLPETVNGEAGRAFSWLLSPADDLRGEIPQRDPQNEF